MTLIKVSQACAYPVGTTLRIFVEEPSFVRHDWVVRQCSSTAHCRASQPHSSLVFKTRSRQKSGPKTVSVGPQCLFQRFNSNSSRFPTSSSNLIKQKTLNSNIPLDNRIASLWQRRCPKRNQRCARSQPLTEVDSFVTSNTEGAKL